MAEFADPELDELTRQAEDAWTDPDVLHSLENHPRARVRAALARNSYTPFSSLVLFETDNNVQVRASLATNPRFVFSVESATSQPENVQRVIARMPHSKPETLDALALNLEIAPLVALNPSAAPATLGRLAVLDLEHENVNITLLHTRLIQNPSTAGDTLRVILNHYETVEGKGYPDRFLPVLFSHLSMEPHLLRRYGGEEDQHPDPVVSQEIRRAVYGNPACPVDMLIRSITNPWSMVAMGEAAENTSTPVDLVAQLN